MAKQARHDRPGAEEVQALTAGLVGLPLGAAARRADKLGYRVVDATEPGWFVADHDPHRIRVVVSEGLVTEASAG